MAASELLSTRKLFSPKLFGFLGASIINGGAGRPISFSASSSSSSPLENLIIRARILNTAFQQQRQHRFFSVRCSNFGKGFLELSDEELLRQCEMDTFKASGPGGQHRNKRESAVRLKHLPTGVIAQAVEDRSQHMNRASALTRLRTLLALKGNASFVGSNFCSWGFSIRCSKVSWV